MSFRSPTGHETLSPDGARDIDVEGLEADLTRTVDGEVRFDPGSRAIYSHDSSNYRQPPVGVVVPQSKEAIVATVAACREHGAAVLPRGCATSLAGQTTNVAVVIDCSKYMREIIDIDPGSRTARVEPGVIRDQLSNTAIREHGLAFAPDTSTHEYATLGGMIGNNSCGIHSVMAGRTADNVSELEVLTYDGARFRVGATDNDELDRIVAEGGRRGEIYSSMRELRDRHAESVRGRYPDIPRRVSGYNLDELLPERGFNVARSLVGSEGTLATVLEATVDLVPWPRSRTLLVLGYPSIFEAADQVDEILDCGPIGLEGIDRRLIEDMLQKGSHAADVPMLPDGDGWLLVEFGGEDRAASDNRARECIERLRRAGDPPDCKVYDDPQEEERIWKIRESGLGATSYVRGEGDHWPGWEDAAVPPSKLGSYLRDFRDLLDRYGYRAALYGHFGEGCIHCRINFDLRTARGLADWRRFLDDAAGLVIGYGGSLSGEHGDGQQRAELLPKMYGPELTSAFRQMKRAWDPDNGMNPHKVVDPYPIVSNMKLGSGYDPPQIDTHFAYSEDDGSFAHAALRCVGAGKCRDATTGTMCPSYLATQEEKHTTRGRARMLYEMLEGDTITDGFRSDDVEDALDLCLSCKGCKAECPVSVDMATYKAEFLSRHYKRRLRPAAAYSMGLIMINARLARIAPRLANRLTHSRILGPHIKRLGGLSPDRDLPKFAEQTFGDWWQDRPAANPGGEPVVLFPDTFSNFLDPEPLKAAAEVLERVGFQVEVPAQALCCGRPLYDYGMLDTAKLFWRRMLKVLAPRIREGVPLVGVEPSCIAAFRDELPGLMPHDEDAKRLSLQSLTLAEFLERHAPEYRWPTVGGKAAVHGHCHQEAVMGTGAEQSLYSKIGLDAEVLDSGCCGLAGSFGFEREHDGISREIAEQRLMPAIRNLEPDTELIADGFSCRTQIATLGDFRVRHTAEVLRDVLSGAGRESALSAS